MRRRDALALSCLLVAARGGAARAQAAAAWRIGFLGFETEATYRAELDALRAGLGEHGYREGGNLVIVARWAEGRPERLPALARELAAAGVTVIVTHATPGVRAALAASPNIPVVAATVGDPQVSGLVANLSRPGGNLTGSTFFQAEMAAKRAEIIKESLPGLRRLAVLTSPDNEGRILKAVSAGAQALGIRVLPFGVRDPGDFAAAFKAMAAQDANAVAVNEHPLFIAHASAIAGHALKARLPSIGFTGFAPAGGWLEYGTDRLVLYRRAGAFVDKILRGARAGDLAFERATKFELVVNVATGKTLGLKPPQGVLLRADRVIE